MKAKLILSGSILTLLTYLGTGLGTGHAEDLTLISTIYQPPKSYYNTAGDPSGFIVEIGQAVLEQAGHSASVQLVPFKRGMAMAGQCLGIMTGVFKTRERELNLRYSEALVADDYVMVVRRHEAFEFTDIQSLKGKRVTHLRGGFYGSEFAAATHFIKDPQTSHKNMLRILKGGRTDVVIMNPGTVSVEWAAKKSGISIDSTFRILSTPLHSEMNYLVGCKAKYTQQWFVTINRAIREMKTDGSIARIYQRYTQAGEEKKKNCLSSSSLQSSTPFCESLD